MIEFSEAAALAARDAGGKGIGTLGEKSLHLALKYYFAPDPETHERKIGGYVADAVTEEGVIEIQTRGLSRLKPKLAAFLPCCPVTVVHPFATEKWLVRVNENGEVLSKRKSPKHESIFTAMREVYTLRDFLMNPRLRICLCSMHLLEYVLATDRRRRPKLDRAPLALNEIIMLTAPEDYAAFLPKEMPVQFSAAELRELLGTDEMHTRIFLNLLARLGCVESVGKCGNTKLWSACDCVSDAKRG